MWRSILSFTAVWVIGIASPILGEEVDFHFENGQTVGIVEQVAGDLAYVSGLNGDAPVLSRLGVMKGVQFNGAKLEVIKVLDRLLVTRIVEENGEPVEVSDRVARLNGEMAPPERRRALRVVNASQVTKGPSLDGRLDDEVWQKAQTIEGFVQRDQQYWMPGTERTLAKIVYDNESMYFGFECFDGEPDRIVANNMRRDSEVFGDDNVQIVLDTYDDRQTGVMFMVNPLGAKRDIMLSNEGRTINDDWDCLWDAKARRHETGWTAEISIPFSQLRFKEGEQEQDVVWGINLGRHIARKGEENGIMIGRESTSGREKYRTTNLAELRGIRSVESEKLFQIKPYILPGSSKNALATDPTEIRNFEMGADVRFGITPNMSLDISYNTDFAQVEADQEQTNLTQFSLFFPEKREFFLEGASLFDFGEAGETRSGGRRPPTLLFYSRRIGLEDGQPVPIMLGTKLAGKAGRTSIGAMHILTDSNNLDDVSDYTVLRVKQDVLSRSNVGFILVNKQTDDLAGLSPYNRSGGMDFSFSPSNTVNIQGFVARTWDKSIGDTDDARFLRLAYRNGKVSTRFTFLDVEDQFEPQVGFVNRRRGLRAYRRYDSSLYFNVQPRAMNIRSMWIGASSQIITDNQNNAQYRRTRVFLSPTTKADDRISIRAQQTYDVVPRPFKPSRRSDISIEPGEYTFTTFVLGPSTSRARKLQVELDFEAGSYYTGSKYTIELESAFRPNGRLSLETNYEANWIRLPQGNLNVKVLSSRMLYSFTTNFFVKLFAQWNNDRQTAGLNFLLNWRYRPGSDLYLVYDQGYDTLSGLDRTNRTLLLKLSYLMGI